MIRHTGTSTLLFEWAGPCLAPTEDNTGHYYRFPRGQLPNPRCYPVSIHTSPPSAGVWHGCVCLLAMGKCVNKILILNFLTKLCSWQLRSNLCVCSFRLLHLNKSFYLQLLSIYKYRLLKRIVIKYTWPCPIHFYRITACQLICELPKWRRKCL